MIETFPLDKANDAFSKSSPLPWYRFIADVLLFQQTTC
jgi:hypothetical protein